MLFKIMAVAVQYFLSDISPRLAQKPISDAKGLIISISTISDTNALIKKELILLQHRALHSGTAGGDTAVADY